MKKAFLPFICWSLLAGICAAVTALAGTYLYLNPSLPDVETLKKVELQTPLRVFTADNKLIAEFGEKRREPITFNEAPKALVDAILSAEDDGFYHHNGVDIKGLVRAALELAVSGSIQSGGSTITMQVARNFFLSRNQTFSRKFNEILLAIKIEQELTKDDIMALYLNKIFLGKRAYGFKAAAKVYYGKELSELTLAQTAMIAGLPKAPSTYNPISNPNRALVRRNWILSRMLELGKITQESYQLALEEPVTAEYHTQQLDLNAPYPAEMAREKALDLLGEKAYTGGYSVYTTIDSELQATGQLALINSLLAYTQRHGFHGPEEQLKPELLTSLPSQQNEDVVNKESDLGAVNLLPWVEELKTIPSYGNLKAAAVIGINTEEKSVLALLATGKAITIPWENGLNKAGKYVNENFFSPHPKAVEKVVALGDVIRVRRQENPEGEAEWHLSQIPKVQGALVSLDPYNGGIKTVVGGFDFKQSSFNRVTQAKRLPGSNFKPFVYSIGLSNGLTAASIFNDAPVVIEDEGLENDWRPENASGKFFGPTRLREALYRSRNLVSIRLLRNLGIDALLENIERFGLDSDQLPRDLSLALGTYSMTPLEIATGYAVFANNGYQVEPFLVDYITDSQGQIIHKSSPLIVDPEAEAELQENASSLLALTEEDKEETPAEKTLIAPITGNLMDISQLSDSNQKRIAPRVLDERVVYIMNSILRDVVQRGTAKRALVLERQDIGGKTGTTNGPTDAWFSGFNHHMVATAWVGFDNNAEIGKREYGGTAALPIWIDYMREALKGTPDELPPRPDGIVTIRVDSESGEPTTPANPNGYDELFLEETAPEIVIAETTGQQENTVEVEEIF